ncbi:cyclic peptide export ABC transporter [Neorhodopirellula lusitana]|nr:cyclic peptide export ABC transporter [Neorhodopirellula lusitana]
MKLFFILARSSWFAGLMSAVLGAISGVASLTLITLIHLALTRSAESPGDQGWLPLAFAGACFFVLFTQVTSNVVLVRLSQATAARLRYELCSKIIVAPLPTLESVGQYRLLATLNNDVGSITAALASFPSVCANAMVLVCGLIYLATLSLPLAAGTILMAALGVAMFLGGLRIADKSLRQAREDQDEVVKQLRAMVHGIKELKGNTTRCLDFVYEVLLPADSRMRHSLIRGQSIQGFSHSWGRLFLFIGIGLLLFVWPRLATVSTATLTGYTLTILYLTYPLDGILGWLPAYHSASISINKIEALGLMIDQPERQSSAALPNRFRSIHLQDITYQHQSHGELNFELGPIDLQLKAGEVTFIAGGNGSGKTTLAKVLTGLYLPATGSITWDGREISDRNRNDFRQLFSTVFVEGHLFDRLLGIELQQDRLQHWTKLLGIEDKVDLETGRLHQHKLSRGQHKRLALLVAALDDRPIFVFDEWAAEQDPGFKQTFYHEIVPELKRCGKTVLAITHDDRFFDLADQVVKLVDGKLLETPSENTPANQDIRQLSLHTETSRRAA